ncbi:hypothetical protein NE237_024277 [Protea cynaroides]|uniref:Cucumisin n=1 Tax=Protea cynaroides TaxID=273540 RepID=A0A9Q0K6Z3_9MAGN|nr:hypothetical protein NE237_024277 [Protea cynaroides]
MTTLLSSSISPLFILALIIAVCIHCGATGEDRKVYIVYMGAVLENQYSLTSQHLSMLEEILEESKIIGARVYSDTETSKSARDLLGHGTHTASTVAGNLVSDVGFYGLAQGNARGGVPSARIAVYKVCGDDGACSDYSLLAAFDDAIADGVDIISISIGGMGATPFDSDSIAIGAFHAMEKGILTSHSTGNDGPSKQTTASVAPWLLSVAASSTDRHIISKVSLGDGTILQGHTINSFILNGTTHPLLYGKEVTKTCSEDDARRCEFGCLDSSLVKGKIILCDDNFEEIPSGSPHALGTIISTPFVYDYSTISPLAATQLSSEDGLRVKSYWNSTKNPQANILKSEAVNDLSAPTVVSFSSRGPNPITQDILKPDITAPGVEILAAYSPVSPPSTTSDDSDTRSVKYSILSGTSMSCPHATGAAAYVKSFHPDWSASAIKSALMTTARSMNATTNPDAEFAYGAGHIDPVKAVDPGLVYVAFKDDYIKFLCNIGWSATRISIISGDNNTCPESSRGTSIDLNYPSMAVNLPPSSTAFAINFPRRVTNVGSPNSTYKASFISDSKINISVKPEVLSFTSLNEEKSFVVTVSGNGVPQGSMASASLVWSDGTHTVRSPIVVYSMIFF